MSQLLVGLQTIQTGAIKQGDVITRYQLGSHLIRKGNRSEQQEVEKKKNERMDPESMCGDAENFGGMTMSLMVAGVMETSIPLSEFLESLWMQNAILAARAPQVDSEEEVFYGAFEVSTPKPDDPALNLLLYYQRSMQEQMERLAASVKAGILPGMVGMRNDGIALAGQVLPQEKVKRRVTSDRDYLYGRNDVWGVYAVKIRFPKSMDYDGYKDGGACLGIHLDDMSSIPFERVVKLATETRAVGMHEAERIQLQEKIAENQSDLNGMWERLTEPSERMLRDIVEDVIIIMNVNTIYDRKLARSRDFWKKIRGV